MSNRLSRFLHLEKDRGGRGKQEPTSRLQGPERFEAHAERRDLPPSEVPEAHLERFKAQPPVALEPPPEPSEDDTPFPRCVVCESENGRFAERCQQCGADLGTPQQHAYNEGLRRTRREERARRETEHTDHLEQLETQRDEDAERYAVLMRKLREEEGRGSFWTTRKRPHRAWTRILLGRIPYRPLRWLLVALWFGVALRLFLFEMGRTRMLGVFMAFVFVVYCIPGEEDRRP
ncbi:hypothetical protein LZ198_17640 [Myxococcus sp. K15C18031901]|uniref:hypothetical protein n=1 Tax=Myxococcus dinghuensis TaxID=2906761 RepID=UPI0020A7C81C|nr:hypothetical protein [Myxococcus dinghuensis]MCP3100696.1 hypothetical protein [Myxococcus dinghuensis]